MLFRSQCNICRKSGFLFRSPGFFAFREEFHEAQSRRILAAAFPRTAAAVSSGPTANDTVQLVSARGPVSVYAPGSDLLAQQWRVYLHGYAKKLKTEVKNVFEATLRNRSQPELGSLTISFPIPDRKSTRLNSSHSV